ncbi:MAG TPA: sugar ABC transporter substrate-binding protein, partial [Marmoricola sp.]
ALDTAPTDGSKVTLYVGNDNYKLGVLEAQQALKLLPKNPSGDVVIGVPNPGTPVLDSRAKGISDTFKKMAPNVKILGPYQTYSDPAQNYGAWQAQVNAHPTALAFLGVGDADSYDLAKIKQQKHGKYVVAGTDVDAKTLEDVKDGSLPFTIDPEHFLKGYIAMQLLIDHKRGAKQPEGWLETPGMVVDSSNIDKVLAREKSQTAAYDFYKPQITSILGNVDAHMHPLKDAR